MKSCIGRAVLATAVFLTSTGTAFGQDAVFDFPRSAEHPLLEYSLIHAKVSEEDRTTTIRISGDGTVHIHRPFWQIGAGDFTTRLGEAELQGLLGEMLAGGAFRFDADAARQACRQADAARLAADGVQPGTSEDSRLDLRIRVTSVRPPGTPLITGPIDHRVEWRNLEWHAETYPRISALTDLLAAETSLRELLDRDDLQAVAPQTGEVTR